MFVESDGTPTELGHNLNSAIRGYVSHVLTELDIDDPAQLRIAGFCLLDGVTEAIHEFSIRQRLKS